MQNMTHLSRAQLNLLYYAKQWCLFALSKVLWDQLVLGIFQRLYAIDPDVHMEETIAFCML